MTEFPFVSVQELAEIVARGRLGSQIRLKQISTVPGKRRWRGFCPFHGDTNTPNFDIYEARAGAKGRFYCQNCTEKGDAADWLARIEGKKTTFKRDPEFIAQRDREGERGARRSRIERRFFDIYPDASPEWRFIIEGLR